ncbi:MAG: CSLREA domain-containing protein, partial [bacterium]|nr:CSLREA domain-containing protein [bacterium]
MRTVGDLCLKTARRAGIGLLAGLLFTGSAVAVTFSVTKFEDDNGPCTQTDCALREAVMAANALSGADRIELEVGVYTLTISGGVEHYYVEESGDLDILDDLEMVGATSGTVIRGQNDDRIIDVVDNVSTFSNIELTGGRVLIFREGGCARLALSEVTLINVSINNCFCEDGGGGLALEGASATLFNTTVSGNECGWIGGGIFQLGTEPEQSLTIINSTISGNTARLVGGGLARLVEGEAMIVHSTITQNEANYGDAIFLDTIRRTPIYNSIIEGKCTGILPVSRGGNLGGPDI